MTSQQNGCCCIGPQSSAAKVAPAPDSSNELIEIRPNRHLRVQHLNPRPRDERFQREMQMFMEYRRHGMSPHVLTSVRPKQKESVKSPTKTYERNDTAHLNNIQNIPGVMICEEESQILEQYDSDISNAIGSHQGQALDDIKSKNDHKYLNDKSEKQSLENKLPVNPEMSLPPSLSSNRVASVNSVSHVHVHVTDSQAKRQNMLPLNSQPTIEEKDEQQTPRTSRTSQNKNYSSNVYDSRISQPDLKSNSSVTATKITTQGISTGNVENVLFFIHGVGGSSNVWVSQLKYFSSLGYEVVCPDLIGHGLSNAPDDSKAYHFDEILEDIEEIFDRYCKRKNVLIGHSYGCAFATVVARKRARRVSKLVLVSGGAPIPLAPQPGIFTLPLCLLKCLTPCISCTFKRNAFHTKSDLPKPVDLAFDIPAYVLSYIMNGQDWPDGDEVFHNWITVATLLIYGEQDQFIGLEDEEDMLNAIFGSRLEVLEHAGHMVMIEAADKFNECLQQFIEDEFTDSEDIANQNEKIDHVTMPSDTSQITNHSINDLDEINHISRNKVSNDIRELTTHGRTTRDRAKSVASETSYISFKSGKSSKSTKSMPPGVLSHVVH